MAANTEGKREIVGLHIKTSEAENFWATFLKGLVRRGLRGVKLVISEAHEGLRAAVSRVLHASWQRCRVGLLNYSIPCPIRDHLNLHPNSTTLTDVNA